ncbi:MAG: hypothetical protein GC168_00875 [Candidatus Hydrogenedens sp.]|nr:hypothetical protein [Candidatus Hydrogenedens sp.]
MTPPSRDRGRSIAVEWLPVAVIMLIALWLRAHQLGRESVWYDEYITISKIHPGSLLETLREQIQFDWFMVPFYHILQYGWTAIFGVSPLAVRWLSILFGMAAMPVLYLLARDLYGRFAGLFAILLMALSPYYIYHSQGIRAYALTLLLGLLSGWLLLRAARGGGRSWWIAQAAATTLLLWTHLLGALILAPQGLYLLLFHRQPWRRFLLWCAYHLAVVATVAIWLSTLSGGVGSPPVEPLPLEAIPQALVTYDQGPLARLEYVLPKDAPPEDLSPALVTLMGLREDWGFQSLRMYAMRWLAAAYLLLLALAGADLADRLQRMLQIRGVPGRWLAQALLVGTLYGLLYITCRTLLEEPWPIRLIPILGTVFAVIFFVRPAKPREPETGVTIYLWLWWSIPVLLMYAIMFVSSRTLFEQRFAIFALPLLYVLAAGGLQRLPGLPLRALAAAMLCGLLLFQTRAYENMPVRHGYLPAARYIESEAAPGDAVIQHLLYQQWLFAYNLGESDLALLESNGMEELYEKTQTEAQARGSVWVVLLSRPALSGGGPDQEGVSEEFAAGLAERGMRYDMRVFPGMQNIYVFHCFPPGAPPEG